MFVELLDSLVNFLEENKKAGTPAERRRMDADRF
jgi:hypothetical protein